MTGTNYARDSRPKSPGQNPVHKGVRIMGSDIWSFEAWKVFANVYVDGIYYASRTIDLSNLLSDQLGQCNEPLHL